MRRKNEAGGGDIRVRGGRRERVGEGEEIATLSYPQQPKMRDTNPTTAKHYGFPFMVTVDRV